MALAEEKCEGGAEASAWARWVPALCAATGALLALSFPGYHLFFLAWVGLVPVLWLTRHAAPRRAAGLFFLAGLAFHLVLLQWLMANVYWGGGWAVIGYVMLSAYLAVYWALFGALRSLLRRHDLRFEAFWLAVFWAAMEYAQATLFSGFGWSALAYSQGPDLAFAQLASLGGTSLIGAILVAVNVAIAKTLEGPRRWRHVAVAVAIIVVVHAVGASMLDTPRDSAPPFHAGLFQSNFPVEMKYDPDYTTEMVQSAADYSRSLAQNAPVELFIWPEALVMAPIAEPQMIEPIAALARERQTPVFTGAQRDAPATGEGYNSSALILPSGEIVGYYDKTHLAPFGEYVPFGKILPFLNKVVPAMSDLTPGTEPKVFGVNGPRFGPLICFEVLFAPMAQRLRAQGAEFLVVITNLGWFGASCALPQELEIARFRSIETRLPMVHVANTGRSGVFDPYGRFTAIEDAPAGHAVGVGDRIAASLPVPPPAKLPWVPGPRIAPLIFSLCAAGMVLALLLAKRFKP